MLFCGQRSPTSEIINVINDKIVKRSRGSENLNCQKRGVAISGCPGLKDLQDIGLKCDVLEIYLIINFKFENVRV